MQLTPLCSKMWDLQLVLNKNGDFISRYYLSLKVANPHVKFMIRESEGITPKIFARYEMGKEDCISVADNTADDIISKLKTLDQP
ncbi:NADH dehydrogenase [ubiquinone] 1 alpha subcomplex subunit 2 [Schistosoma japonicum]|nr:NADH dehydrogenase [ubiquinone] 1 alpha subcomplex subunit 2 [Schistosoma japonicum]KAH8877806.1 NADH dehydrogenase [ubiquinone] 1 alpha subcomplex subunit 2 [Schistosoma japonicum]